MIPWWFLPGCRWNFRLKKRNKDLVQALRLGLVLLVVAASSALFFRPFIVQSYFIRADLERSWVVMEHKNPDCEELDEGWFWRSYDIPQDGYLCTSSDLFRGWTYDRYYRVTLSGEAERLAISGLIKQRTGFETKRYTREGQLTSCIVEGKQFWFGPSETISGHAADIVTARHPECQ